jgi:hypothetical protein
MLLRIATVSESFAVSRKRRDINSANDEARHPT